MKEKMGYEGNGKGGKKERKRYKSDGKRKG